MKVKMYMLFLISITCLGGCSLFGWYMNGDPHRATTPTELSDWTKVSINETQKIKDWVSCGGTSAGMVNFSKQKPGETRYDHSVQAAKEYDLAQACMMTKGYFYTGKCKGPLSGLYACRKN